MAPLASWAACNGREHQTFAWNDVPAGYTENHHGGTRLTRAQSSRMQPELKFPAELPCRPNHLGELLSWALVWRGAGTSAPVATVTAPPQKVREGTAPRGSHFVRMRSDNTWLHVWGAPTRLLRTALPRLPCPRWRSRGQRCEPHAWDRTDGLAGASAVGGLPGNKSHCKAGSAERGYHCHWRVQTGRTAVVGRDQRSDAGGGSGRCCTGAVGSPVPAGHKDPGARASPDSLWCMQRGGYRRTEAPGATVTALGQG